MCFRLYGGCIATIVIGFCQSYSLAGDYDTKYWPNLDGKGFALTQSINGTRKKQKPPAQLPAGAICRFSAPKSGESIKLISFTADGKTLLLRSDSAVLFADVKTGRSRTFMSFKPKPPAISTVRNATLSPNGKILVTNGNKIISGYSKEIFTYWDVKSGKKLKSFQHPNGRAPEFLSFSSDGSQLVWKPFGQSFYVVRDENTGTTKSIPIPFRRVYGAMSPTKNHLAFCGWKKNGYEVQVWDLIKKVRLQTIAVNRRFLPSAVCFSPDGGFLAAGNDIWEINQKTVRIFPQSGTATCWSPDTSAIVLCTYDSTRHHLVFPRLIELATGQEIFHIFDHKRHIAQTLIDKSGQYLATCDGNEVFVWHLGHPPGLNLPKATTLTNGQFEKLWQDLDVPNPKVGYRSLLQLASAGPMSVRLLGKKMKPASAADEKMIRKLIAQLAADSFTMRERATKRLSDIGRTVERFLKSEAKKANGPEVQGRLKMLLNRLKVKFLPGELQQLRAIYILARINSSDARQLLKRLATGNSKSRQTRLAQATLQRLALMKS